MARLKIDYGIDLGTTNSAICRMDKGEIKVIKCDTTDDTMPSCVQFTKRKGLKIGKTAYNAMKSDKRSATKTWKSEDSNIFSEFKRKMGTDATYVGSYMDKSFTPEELSAEVLKNLKSFVSDDEVKSVVITVPAMFNINQKDATMRAAKLAGFEYCELLQEPIAAAMAYGIDSSRKDGRWMVFDFGGGTFDAALLTVKDGIMQVFDTEGNNFLGGKDLDNAMVDRIILPYIKDNNNIEDLLSDPERRNILKSALKTYAEEAKQQLSFKQSYDIITNLGDLGEDDDGNEIELDMTITQEQIQDIFSNVFQEAIDICNNLLSRNNLDSSSLNKIVLVGGPTYSPILRNMLRINFGDIVDMSIDPMTAVAKGAALYASTISNEVSQSVSVEDVELLLDYESTSVETIEFVTIKLKDCSLSRKFNAKIVRVDGGWASDSFALTDKGDVVDCVLQEGRANNFEISLYDEYGNHIPCFPREFTIIQGAKVGSAILPYNFGIEIWDEENNKAVYKSVKGLEKNKSLPAVGIEKSLKTSNEIRPGISSDFMKIPFYQAEYAGDGLPAVYFSYVYEVKLTGENLPALLPAGSDIEISIKIDRPEQISMDIYIPLLDYTEEVVVPRNTVQQTVSDAYILNELDKADSELARLRQDGLDVAQLSYKLEQVRQNFKDENEKEKVLKGLRGILQEAARFDKVNDWDRINKKLDAALRMLIEDNKKYGDEESTSQVNELKKQVEAVKVSKNIPLAKDLLDRMHNLNYKLAMLEYFIAWISGWDKRYDIINWRNKVQARKLIDEAKMLIVNNPSVEMLKPIVSDLVELLPRTEMPRGAEGLLSVS